MTLSISKRVLRWLDRDHEERRQDFRMCLAKTSANAEDVTRTIAMNGFDFKRLMAAEGIKVKDKV